jgi:pyridoxine 5-phosphate synthase
LTIVGVAFRIRSIVPFLSVNIDHVATLRQARRESFPDPVQAAALVELGGAEGITVHLRQDRRHINDRDVALLRATIKTELTVEMAARPEMIRTALRVKPDQVTLVPEVRTEVTTTAGLDMAAEGGRLGPTIRRLRRAGIRVSTFIEPDAVQVAAAARAGAAAVELNTDRYSKAARPDAGLLDELVEAAGVAQENGLEVHVGHGLNYRNVVPLLREGIAEGYSIGFSIVARAVYAGLAAAVAEMKRTMEVYS